MESSCDKLQEVVEYVRRTWVEGRVWTPPDWTVYRETVRTNNDVEGWHMRLNGRAGRGDLGFYVLVPLLYGEAKTVDVQMRLVSANLLKKLQRRQYRCTHLKLQDLWDQYEDDDLMTSELLKRVSLITGLGANKSSRRR